MDHTIFFTEALREAQKSMCTRGHGGAVIAKDGTIIGRGYNAPPKNDSHHAKCHLDQRTSRKPKSDRTCCVHAEWRAITDAFTHGHDVAGSDLYFIGASDDGSMRYSGAPYCTVCSRLALDLGILRFGLWHETGITLYDTATYNDLSYAYHNEPVTNTPSLS